MLLDLAEALTALLAGRKWRVDHGQPMLREGFDEEEAAETTLQLLFFDGEEAFHDWTNTDSIYGARCVILRQVVVPADLTRHLAEKWEETYLEEDHPLSRRRYGGIPSVLNTIDVLVLLDLLGELISCPLTVSS